MNYLHTVQAPTHLFFIKFKLNKWGSFSHKLLVPIVTFLLVLFSFVSVFSFLIVPITVTGTSASVLQNSSQVTSYVMNTHKGKKDLQITAIKQTKIASPNIAQSSMNTHYNNYYYLSGDVAVDGTCTEVASTLLMKSHNANANGTEYVFRTIMNIAKDNNYWFRDAKDKKKVGTKSDKIDSLVTDTFYFWRSKKKGNSDHLNIYSNLVSNIDNGKTSIFSCADHSMHAVGYAEYTVTYKVKVLCFYVPTSSVAKFVIVNDGWYNATNNATNEQYSYYPADLISTTKFVLTKVI
ncbi:MAG: hypothetical protein LBF68_07760 [Christensenellaceae bacterium]|jgi:hypothetical protein|nr:hypothetical protein [Christensenellaceae bacterium]